MIILPKTNFGKEIASINEVGRRFSEYGSYTDAPYLTEEWHSFWNREQRRILGGYQVGDLHITGDHYFYLNYTPILRANFKAGDEVVAGKVSVEEIKGFPDFWDYDWHFFNCKSEARRRGKHLIVLKARRKGYSYKIASILVKAYSLIPNSKGFAFAEMKEYLLGDGFLTKAFMQLNFIDSNTAFAQPRLNDQEMMKRSGYKRNINGTDVEEGNLSEIHGITIGNDPDKARGKAGLHGIFEEAGKFKGLKKTWNVAKSSYEKGRFKVGMMMAFGTGGSEDADFEDLSEMFYDPDAYDCLAFENVWDEGSLGTKCCFFVPAYVNLEGFIDEYGNSDIEGAKDYRLQQREIAKSAKDPQALAQETSEHPFTPKEATLNIDQNIFPIAELQAHLNSVNAKKLWRQAVSGKLYKDADNTIKFKPTGEHPPVHKFPHDESMDLTGCITMTEAPYRPNGESPPAGLYMIVHDPYAKDETKEKGSRMSLGAAYVIKNVSSLTPTLNTCIVASYVGRPRSQDEYNRNLFLLAEYYNAKIGFENNRGNVIQYAKKKKKLQYLKPELDILDKRERARGRKTSISYGITTNKQVHAQGEIYLRDWLLEPVKVYEDGTEKLRLHYIIDPALLDELIKFNWDGNFDRVMALLIGMFYIEDQQIDKNRMKPEHKKKVMEFFDKEVFV